MKDESPSSVVLRPSSTFGEALARAANALARIDAPALTAQVLLAQVVGLTRTQVLARPEQRLTEQQQAGFDALLGRAAAGEPLAYLTGHREFYGLDFWVTSQVLVPRPESELLVDLGLVGQPRHILDVGTGSGCLAVALAAKLPEAAVTAVDIAPEALDAAQRNAERHGVAARLTFIRSDLLAAWQPQTDRLGTRPLTPPPPANFDLIVANLPYIDSDELRGLEVARHEPWMALDGGPGGLVLVEQLLSQAPRCLAPGGRLLLEIGATQGRAALALARAAFPGAQVTLHQDLAGLDRVVAVRLGKA
jgi:release factor glutamine methyltransferase